MNLLLSAVPWYVRILAIAALAAAVFGYGWMKGVAHDQPIIDQANTKIGQMQNSLSSLQASTTRQNAAISSLEALAKNRADQAAADIKAASVKSRTLQGKAQAVMGLRPPPGIDECKSAQQSFDDELKAERGK